MKYLKTAVLTLALLSLNAFAHDGSHAMKGTVTAMTANTITIETPAKKTMTIHFDDKTTFTKSEAAATAKDLKVGDRVVIEAHDMDGKMHAVKIRFGKPKKAASSKATAGADHSKHAPEKQ